MAHPDGQAIIILELYHLSNVIFENLFIFSKTQRTFFTPFGTVHDNSPYTWPYYEKWARLIVLIDVSKNTRIHPLIK
jgi:hypothetical protein